MKALSKRLKSKLSTVVYAAEWLLIGCMLPLVLMSAIVILAKQNLEAERENTGNNS